MGDKLGKQNKAEKQRQSDDKLYLETKGKREKHERNMHLPALNSLMKNYAGTRPSSH